MMMRDAARGRLRLSMVCFMAMAGLMGMLAGCDGGGHSNGDGKNPPTAVIDAIAPNPADQGQLVTFSGHGSDTDGAITGYKWSSSISGDLNDNASFSTSDLPAGDHTISFLVQTDDGAWSDPVTLVLNVQPVSINHPPAAVIDDIAPSPADQGQLVTFTGRGSDTDGAISGYKWNSSISGDLDDNASFSTSDLPAGDHTISFLVKDDDGAWSDPITRVLTVQPVIPNNPPAAVIDDVTPNPADKGQTVSFTGHGSDMDGAITGYKWSSSISGVLNNKDSFSTSDLPAGDHTISFLVQDDDGAWSDPVTLALNVQPAVINHPPTAVIDAISPNPADAGQMVTFSGYGNDADGVIASYLWSSSLSGTLSLSSSFSSELLPVGAQTISLQVQDDDGAWSVPVTMSLTINAVTSSVEQMYLCLGYGSGKNTRDFLENWLLGKGAYKDAGVWKYTSPQGKDFVIHFVQDIAGMRQALTTRGAHVIYRGHSNFGLGTSFATDEEEVSAIIDDIYTIDDPRIFNYSSPWIHVNVRRLRTHQAYPNWWPVFQDGASGIMPYDFDDPAGDPPYNYYITYQIPGDPTRTHHLLQSANVGSIQRFPDSGRPAWYSADGSKPDPDNPDHLQYFITNPAPWSSSLHITGDWLSSWDLSGFFRDDYLYLPAGYSRYEVEYLFTAPEAGQYRILAWWPASPSNTASAKYIVNHDGGSSVVSVNQKEDGGQWNEIGVFPFQAGDYSVIISGQAGSGQVVADGIRVVALDNPPSVIQADFTVETRYGPAPLDVSFENASTGDITSYDWDFGDGNTDHTSMITTSSYNNRPFMTNTYTSPGTYTVRLTASGPDGTSTKVKTDYIVVGSGPAPLCAEFSGKGQQDNAPLKTTFSDMSSGQIVAWSWDFDDDGIVDSTDQNPSHTYLEPGNYTVSLTVTDAGGHSATERKTNFVLARLYDKSIDNVAYPKSHYRSKTIIFRKALEVPKAELRYSRLFYDGCNTGSYFLDTFNRGIVFYTVNNSNALGFTTYLKYYLIGKSDQEIWEQMQKRSAVYDYYDFNKLPSKQ